MFAQHPSLLFSKRTLTLMLCVAAMLAASIALAVPSASADTISAPSPSCGSGVKVIDESSDALWCAIGDTPVLQDVAHACPDGAQSAGALGIDETNLVGMNNVFVDGSCYLQPTCPSGYNYLVAMASGTARYATCQPAGTDYQPVSTADKCAATDGSSAQWFADSQFCGVAITPPQLADATGFGGPSNAEQDCYAAGGQLIAGDTVCALAVYSNDLTPGPTVPPPATQTPAPTVAPTATATATPAATVDPKPTATPVATVDPKPTATAVPTKPTATAVPTKPTPTPKKPDLGFTG